MGEEAPRTHTKSAAYKYLQDVEVARTLGWDFIKPGGTVQP